MYHSVSRKSYLVLKNYDDMIHDRQRTDVWGCECARTYVHTEKMKILFFLKTPLAITFKKHCDVWTVSITQGGTSYTHMLLSFWISCYTNITSKIAIIVKVYYTFHFKVLFLHRKSMPILYFNTYLRITRLGRSINIDLSTYAPWK